MASLSFVLPHSRFRCLSFINVCIYLSTVTVSDGVPVPTGFRTVQNPRGRHTSFTCPFAFDSNSDVWNETAHNQKCNRYTFSLSPFRHPVFSVDLSLLSLPQTAWVMRSVYPTSMKATDFVQRYAKMANFEPGQQGGAR